MSQRISRHGLKIKGAVLEVLCRVGCDVVVADHVINHVVVIPVVVIDVGVQESVVLGRAEVEDDVLEIGTIIDCISRLITLHAHSIGAATDELVEVSFFHAVGIKKALIKFFEGKEHAEMVALILIGRFVGTTDHPHVEPMGIGSGGPGHVVDFVVCRLVHSPSGMAP